MIKHIVNFYLANKNINETNVIMTVSFLGKRLKFNLANFKLNPDNWIPEMQRANKKLDKNFNVQLEYLVKQIEEYFNNNMLIETKQLQTFIKHLIRGENVIGQVNIGFYRELYYNTKTTNSRTSIKYTLEKYFNFKYVADININSIMQTFKKYNTTTKKNSIAKIRAFCNWLKKSKIVDITEILEPLFEYNRKLKINKQKNHLIALTEPELEILFNAEPKKHLHKVVLDNFLIQCYTGQRHSDLIKINKNNIELLKEPINGIYGYISLVSKKTKTYVKIPIHKRLFELLERNNFRARQSFRQNDNIIIKLACKSAGLTDIVTIDNGDVQKSIPKYMLITTHTARRTFITLMLKKKVPIKAIMDVSGIREINTIMNYQKLLKDESAQMIADAFNE